MITRYWIFSVSQATDASITLPFMETAHCATDKSDALIACGIVIAIRLWQTGRMRSDIRTTGLSYIRNMFVVLEF